MTTPLKKHWPKRPVLDYSKDEFIRINVGTAPNIDTFYVSKIRLAYYSPYFRTSLNFPREDSQVIELPDMCPKIFRHIVQYMNTGTIIIPESNEVIVDHNYPKNTPRERHLNLPTLAHIWFLAHYLLIPHIQNIAIFLMHARMKYSADTREFSVDEMITALNIACGTDGTIIAEGNDVIDLLQLWMIWDSDIDDWAHDQKERVPGKVLDIVAATWRMDRNSPYYHDYYMPRGYGIGEANDHYVKDKIDEGDVVEGLPEFPRYKDSYEEDRKQKEKRKSEPGFHST
ncbi:uncharacterized protein Bfra_010062 [Botrytis fragariae]|uniref:BTB domain-containing protein n=1 Tax=Botrytis fragariae TaxID=1964551 RepID=A0A8H6ALQ8_9HELO|nr:uncharacterized protein Bfra_010062 [Botrytis fragariae]KAF5869917.1 hypothetical protein Bfra_010062 [Botrytis fragariae]